MITIAVANQKGGVGKTTIVFILEFINKRAKSQSNNAANKDRKNLKAFYAWV